jgi:hypothetical protein
LATALIHELAVVKSDEPAVNVAVTDLLDDIATIQWSPPLNVESHPLQLPTEELEPGVAKSVTDVPEEYEAEHVEPQFIPDG